jgi:glycosyltransferase involved in cell wall biosynthesis
MNDPLNTVIIGPSTRFLSGISYYTMRLSNALSGQVNVTAILFRHMLPKRFFPGWKRVGNDLSLMKFEESVQVLEILDWYNPFSWLSAIYQMRKCDLIIFQWWTSSVSHMYLALQLMNIRKIPVILEFHEVIDPLENSNFFLRTYAKVMGSLIRRFAAGYVAHSKADRELIAQRYSIDRDKVEIIPVGLFDQYPRLDKVVAQEKLKIQEENIILFFGLLRSYKGVKFLIQAFESLPKSILEKSRLLIVGEAWEDRESVSMAAQSPANNKITVVDRYIPDEEIPLFFSAADVLILPYTRASQSGVAHIGMTYGLPIIATRVGGLKESLAKYEGTFFIAASDVDAICKNIEAVYSNKRRYEPPHNLRWETISSEWVSFITKIGCQTEEI